MLADAPFRRGVPLATLVHNAEEIAPRELKPALYELEGSPRVRRGSLQAVRGVRREAERDPRELADVDLSAGNQVYSEVACAQGRPHVAIGGVKNHEIYFEHLGGDGGNPTGPIADLIERDSAGPRTGAPT
jgi:Fe-Mn family superoxide dismutase